MSQEVDIWRITLDTNPEDCNLACIICEEHSPYSRFKAELLAKTGMKHRRMDRETLDNLILEAVQLGVREIIPSTMGEPLLYRHIDRFFELAEKYGYKVNLTTNGTFPSRSIEEWAKMIIPNTSDVKISWNGSTPEIYESVMTKGNYSQACISLAYLVNYRNQHFAKTGYYCSISLQTTFMSHTMEDLPELVEFAAKQGVDRVKGHQLWAHFDEIKNLAISSKAEYIQQWNTIVEKCYALAAQCPKPDGSLLRLDNFYPISSKADGVEMMGNDYVCPFLGQELWVSATGKISPCCAPDQQRSTLGDFGNVRDKSLSEVVNSPEYQHLLRHYHEKPVCQACKLRRPTKQ